MVWNWWLSRKTLVEADGLWPCCFRPEPGSVLGKSLATLPVRMSAELQVVLFSWSLTFSYKAFLGHGDDDAIARVKPCLFPQFDWCGIRSLAVHDLHFLPLNLRVLTRVSDRWCACCWVQKDCVDYGWSGWYVRWWSRWSSRSYCKHQV